MFRSVPLAIVLAAVTACGDDDPTTPTIPTPILVTEVFSGTINQNSAATHTFTTVSGGTVTVTLTSIGPDSAMISGAGARRVERHCLQRAHRQRFRGADQRHHRHRDASRSTLRPFP